jgi:hypothetical protein
LTSKKELKLEEYRNASIASAAKLLVTETEIATNAYAKKVEKIIPYI